MRTKVNYNSPEGGVLRIFYCNTDNTFKTQETLFLKRDFDSSLKINVYNYRNLTPSTTAINYMKQMNPKWRDYPTANANDIDNENERMSAWFYEQTEWDKYINKLYSTYAMGSPSVEMYMKAFNIYKQNNSALICKVDNTIEPGPNYIFMSPQQYWWLASPSFADTNHILRISGSYSAIYTQCEANHGICPVVPLDL